MNNDIFPITDELVRRQPGAALQSASATAATPDSQLSYLIDLNDRRQRAAVETIARVLAS